MIGGKASLSGTYGSVEGRMQVGEVMGKRNRHVAERTGAVENIIQK